MKNRDGDLVYILIGKTMIPDGVKLKQLQRESNISISKLSRMLHVSRSSIYRAFDDIETKDSTRILIYLALTKPELFNDFNKK